MTIACLYLSPEGIVLGADSTSSVTVEKGLHYLNFNQKVFEIGENSTLGLLTWGLGGLGSISYRTLIAQLSDDLLINPAKSVPEVAERWINHFWTKYQSFQLVLNCNSLNQKQPYNPSLNVQDPNARTKEEENIFLNLKSGLCVGFCIAGYTLPDRTPIASEILFEPLGPKPTAKIYREESIRWWGVPNIIQRLIMGADANLINAIIGSGHWTGTQKDLESIISSQHLYLGNLPMRDAIDYVYSCIHSTIKAMKFSNMSQVCGGPIEVSVITTDRRFRWVRHKSWDAAIVDGDI